MKGKAIICLTALALFGQSACAAILEGDWPMVYHDIQHSGTSNANSSFSLKELALLCTYQADADVSAPVAADINDDGQAEIIFGSADKNLYVLDSRCQKLWSFEAGGAVSAPGVYDLWNDSSLEIVFGSADGKVYVLDSTGKELWTYATGGPVLSSPGAANLDSLPSLEVVAASTDKNLYVLDANGRKLRSYPLLSSLESTPAIGNINREAKQEIVMGTSGRGVNALEYPGLQRWDFPVGSTSDAVISDVNRDGLQEIVVGAADGHIYYLYYAEYQQGSVRKCSPSGNCTVEPIIYSTLVKGWDYATGGEIACPPLAVDLDGNLQKEIIAGSSDKTLYIMNNTGKVRFKSSVNSKILSSPVAADLDGDRNFEIIFGSSDGTVHILNSTGFHEWSYETGDVIDQQPAVADLDRDDSLEIIIASGKKLHVFGRKPSEALKPAPTTIYFIPTTSTAYSTTTSTTLAYVPATNLPTTTVPEKESVDITPGNFLSFLSRYLIICIALLLIAGGLYDWLVLSHRSRKMFDQDLKEIDASQGARSMKHI